jgi:hypothetical protein
MRHVSEHTFEAPVERAWEMFRDQASHIAKFESMGHRDIEVVEFEADEAHAHLVISRTVDVDLPGFAKKVMQPTNTVITTDDWKATGEGTYDGVFVLETKGAPVQSSGTTFLRADGPDRSFYRITVDVDVKVPIIGGKIANWAKGLVERQLELEFVAGDDWLAAH